MARHSLEELVTLEKLGGPLSLQGSPALSILPLGRPPGSLGGPYQYTMRESDRKAI